MKFSTVTIVSSLVLGSSLFAQAQQSETQVFAETTGVTEFSGRLTIRPLQIDALMEQGYTRSEAVAIHENAGSRLVQWQKEYFSDTDEYIVNIPEQFNENTLSAYLMGTGDYQYAEPDWICYPTELEPNDPGFGSQWQHSKMKSTKAWDYGVGNGTFISTTVDTGVDLDHPDLEDALISGYNSKTRQTQANGGQVNDINGHGTMTIGCVGAIGNNGNNVVGMAWDIKLMPVRCTNNSNGSASLGDLTHGAKWASDNGARSVSVSYSGGTSSSVETAGSHMRNEGTLLSWSAGNGGNKVTGSNHTHVIVVSASNQSDNVTSWSTYGNWVDVAAPGESVRTTTNGGGAGNVSGTSFSAPIVNGVLSMMMLTNPSSSADQIEQMLFDNCVDIESAGEDIYSGNGRPNFFKCMRAASEAEYGVTNTIAMTGPKVGVAGQNVTYDWTGAPASSSWKFYYALTPYGSTIGGQHFNIGMPPKLVGSGNNNASGVGSFTKKLPAVSAGMRVYVEVSASSGGQTFDSNMIVLDIN
ncbi:MAG: S8 family serine peptidase [Planctomycetes bacterium]|nr:S8 family serine peptidase [Planctomycetota bacterium]